MVVSPPLTAPPPPLRRRLTPPPPEHFCASPAAHTLLARRRTGLGPRDAAQLGWGHEVVVLGHDSDREAVAARLFTDEGARVAIEPGRLGRTEQSHLDSRRG